jgi:predicted XRE-type DNA-binding protein
MKKITQMATRSSGNVFADAGIPNAEEHELKARIVIVIMDEIQNQGLSQKDAAAMMDLSQPDVSRILRGDFAGFSLGRLLRFVQKLGRDVKIEIPRASRGKHSHQGRLLMHAH